MFFFFSRYHKNSMSTALIISPCSRKHLHNPQISFRWSEINDSNVRCWHALQTIDSSSNYPELRGAFDPFKNILSKQPFISSMGNHCIMAWELTKWHTVFLFISVSLSHTSVISDNRKHRYSQVISTVMFGSKWRCY